MGKKRVRMEWLQKMKKAKKKKRTRRRRGKKGKERGKYLVKKMMTWEKTKVEMREEHH
jgi:hypothetical protein